MSEDRVVEGLAAEVQRLREGIATHQARWGITSRSDMEYRESANRDLWSLLDGEADR